MEEKARSSLSREKEDKYITTKKGGEVGRNSENGKNPVGQELLGYRKLGGREKRGKLKNPWRARKRDGKGL